MYKFDDPKEIENLLEIEKLLEYEIAKTRRESRWAWKLTLYRTEKKGREDGIKMGVKQGIEQRNLEIARTLINSNVSMDTIINSTGLSEAEILKLKSK